MSSTQCSRIICSHDQVGGRVPRWKMKGAAFPQQDSRLGAPIECVFGQNLDNFLTNVQVLSRFCPSFVQVLSMSNNCQNNLNFTKFCLIFVNILSNIFVNCPRFVWRLLLCPWFLYIWQNLDKKCPHYVQVLSLKCLDLVTRLFVNILSMSNFCPTFV